VTWSLAGPNGRSPRSPTAEAALSNSVQCGFESHRGHPPADRVGGLRRPFRPASGHRSTGRPAPRATEPTHHRTSVVPARPATENAREWRFGMATERRRHRSGAFLGSPFHPAACIRPLLSGDTSLDVTPRAPRRRASSSRWSGAARPAGRPSPLVTGRSVRRPALYSALTNRRHAHCAGRPNPHELDSEWRPTPRIWCFRSPHARLLTAPVSDDSSARRQTSCHGESRGRS
jgi:hypothetical protein